MTTNNNEHPAKREETRRRRTFLPPADVLETENGFVVIADMPGVDESGLDINVERSTLTVVGHVESSAPEGFRLAHEGYGEGDYRRQFTLPEDIDVEHIDATVKDGVLRLTLPRSPKSRPRKIPVRALN